MSLTNNYSNCLIVALIIRLRLGGKLKWLWNIRRRTFPHFYVTRGQWIVDFCPYDTRAPWYGTMWFKGFIRLRKKKQPSGVIYR